MRKSAAFTKSIYDELTKSSNIVDSYIIGPYKIIIKKYEDSYYYLVYPLFDFNDNIYLYAELSELIIKMKDRLSQQILKFDELVNTLQSIILWKIAKLEDLDIEAETLAKLFIYKFIKLDKLLPLFTDDNINEIYMDQKDSFLYIDHQIYGRCNTVINLTNEEIEAFLTRIKLEHSVSVSFNNPSLKVEIRSNEFHIRISMDFPPLSPNGPSFNIRKIHNNPLTLHDLIRLNTLPPLIAAYLVEAVKKRHNITIIGEPGSGKTTLANAIDLYTPKEWRKIVIEDAIESIEQTTKGYKQTIIQVDSFESNKSNYTKSKEILKLLHRSPDWIYLGEIQSKEHTKAMFEALNAGLKGIQTAHSDSISKLFRRWKNSHGITNSDLLSLDIIIIMEKNIENSGLILRKIKDIYEISSINETKKQNEMYSHIYNNSWDINKIINKIATRSKLSENLSEIKDRTSFFSSFLENGGETTD